MTQTEERQPPQTAGPLRRSVEDLRACAPERGLHELGLAPDDTPHRRRGRESHGQLGPTPADEDQVPGKPNPFALDTYREDDAIGTYVARQAGEGEASERDDPKRSAVEHGAKAGVQTRVCDRPPPVAREHRRRPQHDCVARTSSEPECWKCAAPSPVCTRSESFGA